MSSVRIELNSDGVRELLKSQEIRDVCAEFASKAVSRLGEGYSSTIYTGKNRVNASVYAESVEAKRENLENNTILKAIRG